jgi:predicted glycosyltransferase
MRRETIRATALSFEPDVLLVDHMPHGAMGELVPTLEALEPFPVRTVLGLRDILDAPATVRRRWQLEGALEAVERHFHDVLVYGSRDVFDMATQYGWPARLSRRLTYCGYVCSPPTTSRWCSSGVGFIETSTAPRWPSLAWISPGSAPSCATSGSLH